MKQARILPLLGPALVLYLIADGASTTSGLDLGGWLIAAAAVACSLIPLFLEGAARATGARRVGWLGVASGLSLLPAVSPAAESIAPELARASGLTLVAALLIDLAMTIPDAPRALDRGPIGRLVPALLCAAVGLTASFAILPAAAASGVLIPARWADGPQHLLLAGILLALGLRLLRRQLGSGPMDLARNGWPVFGLALALAATVLDRVMWFFALEISPAVLRALPVSTALALAGSHIPLVDDRPGFRAGATIRRALSVTLTVGTVGGVGASLAPFVPRTRAEVGIALVATVLFAALVHRLVSPWVERLLAPFGGRLLVALRSGATRLGRVTSVTELGAAILPPLRTAAGADEADPKLYVLDPALEIRVDAAGLAHVRAQPLPVALEERMRERPGEVLVRRSLEDLSVRRPELRGVVEALVALDALAVAPLSVDGELEGALVVPRGRRRSAPTLEELEAIGALGDRVSGLVSLLAAERRAQGRAGEGDVVQRDLADRIDELAEERDRLRAESEALKAGPDVAQMGESLIAYGPAMRALRERLIEVAQVDAPVLLDAEGGAGATRVARELHDLSARNEGPMVIVDCAGLKEARAAAELFGEIGDDGRPGFLQLARGGSLFLSDVAALPIEVQRTLAECLAERETWPVGGAGAVAIDVRVIAATRVPLDELVQSGAFDADLAHWLTRLRVRVPPLRERAEDIPSLTLIAIHRACRVLGRAPVGIDDEALDRLSEHDWPGNVRELMWVVTRAVAASGGRKLGLSDLPSLAGEPAVDDGPHPLDGFWAELEQRILLHALERANGNKSEAARLLGLKRTTFLDKLRRNELAPAGKSVPPDARPS